MARIKDDLSPQARAPLRRIQYIHRQLAADLGPNATHLAQALEVTTKTIQRDIRTMRDDMGFPIDWDASANGYFYTSKDFSDIPLLKVTEGQALALFVAHEAMAQYRGTPFEGPLKTAFRHLAEQMTDVVTFTPVELKQYVSFAHTGEAITNLKIYDEVMGALLDEKEITFRYRKLDSLRPKKRTVRPYHLACINNQWYLIAWDLKRRDYRTFVLGRIREVLGYGDSFTRPADFSPAQLLANSFGVFQGHGDYRVVLEFDAFGAQLVRERTWHPTQKIEEKENGGLIIRLQLGALEEFERWVLSFGSHVKVLDPPDLRKRIRKAARDMIDLAVDAPWIRDLREELDDADAIAVQELLLSLTDPARDHPGQLDLRLPD